MLLSFRKGEHKKEIYFKKMNLPLENILVLKFLIYREYKYNPFFLIALQKDNKKKYSLKILYSTAYVSPRVLSQ